MKPDSVSIREISKITGVSVATVSRVINNNGRFSKETEARVKKALKEYNYTPNLAARGLRTKRIATVGVVVPDITNEYFARITLHLQERLFAHSYSTIICNTDEKADIERRHLDMLLSQQVSGVMYVSGTPHAFDRLSHLPAVFIDREPQTAREAGNYSLIESDNFLGGTLAARELLQKGCRRLCIFKYRDDISTHNAREAGFRQAAREAGLHDDAVRVEIVPDVSVRQGYEKAKAVWRAGGFDGLFCTADALAVGACNALRAEGVEIPGRVKLVGYDDTAIAHYGAVPLTSVHQSTEEIGRLAADTLLQIIDGKQPERRHITLPVHLVVRASTGGQFEEA